MEDKIPSGKERMEEVVIRKIEARLTSGAIPYGIKKFYQNYVV